MHRTTLLEKLSRIPCSSTFVTKNSKAESGEVFLLEPLLEEVEEKNRGKASLARLEATLNAQYAKQCENKVYQYRWALRHPVVKEAITKAFEFSRLNR